MVLYDILQNFLVCFILHSISRLIQFVAFFFLNFTPFYVNILIKSPASSCHLVVKCVPEPHYPRYCYSHQHCIWLAVTTNKTAIGVFARTSFVSFEDLFGVYIQHKSFCVKESICILVNEKLISFYSRKEPCLKVTMSPIWTKFCRLRNSVKIQRTIKLHSLNEKISLHYLAF